MSYQPDSMMTTARFVVVPGTLLSMGLPPVELSVLMQLVKLAQSGASSPDSSTLSRLTKVSRKEVVDAITRLEERRLVKGGKIVAILPGDGSSNPSPSYSPPPAPSSSQPDPTPLPPTPPLTQTPTHTPPVAATVAPTPTAAATPAATQDSSSSSGYCSPKGTPYSPPRKTPSRFQRPTLEQVQELFAERLLPKVEAQKFHDYFESVGWVVGKGKPMRCWKSAAANWKRNYLDAGGRLLSKGEARVQQASDTNTAPANWKDRLDQWLQQEFPDAELEQVERIEQLKSGSWDQVPCWLQQEALA